MSGGQKAMILSCLAATAMILLMTDDLVPRIKTRGVPVDSFLHSGSMVTVLRGTRQLCGLFGARA